jgi:uncharacterized protein (TIGR02646 family)
LVVELLAMTQNHCSFCDCHPMTRIGPTIEHFKPKIDFPLLAYQWENLFICCHRCQWGKCDQYSELLLKPDLPDYEFDQYFSINWVTCEIVPKWTADVEIKMRAEITIQMYNLNGEGRADDRKMELEKFQDSNNPNLDQFPFRFFIKRAREVSIRD